MGKIGEMLEWILMSVRLYVQSSLFWMGPEQDGLFLIEMGPYLVCSDHCTISPLSWSDGISLPAPFSGYCCSPSIS